MMLEPSDFGRNEHSRDIVHLLIFCFCFCFFLFRLPSLLYRPIPSVIVFCRTAAADAKTDGTRIWKTFSIVVYQDRSSLGRRTDLRRIEMFFYRCCSLSVTSCDRIDAILPVDSFWLRRSAAAAALLFDSLLLEWRFDPFDSGGINDR